MEFGEGFFIIKISVGLGLVFSFDVCVCVCMHTCISINFGMSLYKYTNNSARMGPILVPYVATSEQPPIRKGSVPHFYHLYK